MFFIISLLPVLKNSPPVSAIDKKSKIMIVLASEENPSKIDLTEGKISTDSQNGILRISLSTKNIPQSFSKY